MKNSKRYADSAVYRYSIGMIAACIVGFAAPAFAQDPRDPEDGKVAVGGEHILTVRFPTNTMSIRDRAEKIEERLVLILADPALKPSDIRAQLLPGGGSARIMVKERLLVTVDVQTARYNQMTPLALAQKWTEHLRIVLPKVNVKPNPNIINEGGSGTVPK